MLLHPTKGQRVCLVVMERGGRPLFKKQTVFTQFAFQTDVLCSRKMAEGPSGSAYHRHWECSPHSALQVG